MAKFQSGKHTALLVGCNYPSNGYRRWGELKGCHNDVDAVRATLIGVYVFDPNNIEVLTDKPGGTQEEAMPTGENIKYALERLISQLRNGDVLFFHFSGHGTRIPSQKCPKEKVEAIVPCDGNFITNMDFRILVDRVPKGATFVFFSDSCHSGGLIDKEKEQIGPNTLSRNDTVQSDNCRFIPYETVLTAIQETLSMSRGIDNMPRDVETIMLQMFGSEASLLFRQTRSRLPQPLKPDQGILLSACQSNERADECVDNEGRRFGSFTYAVQVIIKEKLLPQPFSNKQLVMKAREIIPTRIMKSKHNQKAKQHPCLYCSDANMDRNFISNAMKRNLGMRRDRVSTTLGESRNRPGKDPVRIRPKTEWIWSNWPPPM